MARESNYLRYGAAIQLVVAVALVPLIAWGVYRAIRSNSNDVRDWLPADYPETQQYRWFTKNFGAQDFILASWTGCTLDDPRLDQFVDQLSNRAHNSADGAALGRIFTGRSLVEQLSGPPVELSRKLAITRLRG